MGVQVVTKTKTMEATTGTELTRFNALRHSILSRFTVLPWESSEEYESQLQLLVAEHSPQGPTEEHLVEELAHIIWRKRRLRLAEAAAHRRALGKVLSGHSSLHEPVTAIPPISEGEWTGKALAATDQQSAHELEAIKQEQDKAKAAVEVFQAGGANAYEKALQKLGPGTREHWQERLEYDFEDGNEYEASATDLLKFLTKVLRDYAKRETHIKSRPVVQAQAFGESFDPDRFETLPRYERHLDRKFERLLSMLLSLQTQRRSVDGPSVSQ
jgi:hypothetical protein